MQNRTLVAVVAGARPNFMKVAPLVRLFDRRAERFGALLIHTGQHYDAAMSDVFFDDLGMRPRMSSSALGQAATPSRPQPS